MHESLSLKLREDLSINCDAIQSLSIEISSTKSKNIIISTIYRPNGDMKQCETHLKDIFSRNGKNLKNGVRTIAPAEDRYVNNRCSIRLSYLSLKKITNINQKRKLLRRNDSEESILSLNLIQHLNERLWSF